MFHVSAGIDYSSIESLFLYTLGINTGFVRGQGANNHGMEVPDNKHVEEKYVTEAVLIDSEGAHSTCDADIKMQCNCLMIQEESSRVYT